MKRGRREMKTDKNFIAIIVAFVLIVIAGMLFEFLSQDKELKQFKEEAVLLNYATIENGEFNWIKS